MKKSMYIMKSGRLFFPVLLLPADFCQVRNGLESIERDSQWKRMWQSVKPVSIPECQPALTRKHTPEKKIPFMLLSRLVLSYPFAKVEGGKREDEGRYQKS